MWTCLIAPAGQSNSTATPVSVAFDSSVSLDSSFASPTCTVSVSFSSSDAPAYDPLTVVSLSVVVSKVKACLTPKRRYSPA